MDAGETAFAQLVEIGATNGDSLFIRVGMINDGKYDEWGYRAIGPNADEFAENVDPKNGKLATVLEYFCDSIEANRKFETAQWAS
jgi:hypothetical protein